MFKTYRPDSVEALLDIIDKDVCHIFAGGTDIMIRKRQWQGAERKFTQSVVYINHLEALRGIKETNEHYIIGTLTTQTDMETSHLPEYIREPYRLMSSPAIRNVATVGGNIVNAAAVADSLPILYALDASVVLLSKYGKRVVKIEDFVIGKYKTIRENNELLIQVLIPKFDEKGYFYKKLGQRKASILSKLSVFVLYKEKDIRITIGAVNDLVIRDKSLEYELIKNKDVNKMLEGYLQLMQGKDDKRSTKNYREQVSINLIKHYMGEIIDEL